MNKVVSVSLMKNRNEARRARDKLELFQVASGVTMQT